MVAFRIALLVALPLLSLFAQTSSVAGTRVSLQPPAGMTKAERFAGFESKEEEASVMVIELPGDVSQAKGGFRDAEKLKAQRMVLQNSEPVKIAPGPAELFVFTQRVSGSNYKKWVLVFGDTSHSVLVTASCAEELVAKWEPEIRKSLLSVTETSGAATQNAAGFAVQPTGDFKQAQAMTNSLAFTPGGAFPPKSPNDPLFLATRSIAPTPIGSLSAFAESRAKGLPGVQTLKIIANKPLTLDGLEGVELTARANESQPDGGLAIYEVVLGEKQGGYYLLIGLGPGAQEAEFFTVFRKMAESFKRDQK